MDLIGESIHNNYNISESESQQIQIVVEIPIIITVLFIIYKLYNFIKLYFNIRKRSRSVSGEELNII